MRIDLRLVAGLLRAEREGYPAAGPDADHALAALCRRAGLLIRRLFLRTFSFMKNGP
jgi:hypothetical protein